VKPILSYTIWFSQRTGSTLLAKALASTGLAGKPNEWLYINDEKDFLEHYGVRDYPELQERLWDLGSTSNGVFGIKMGYYEPGFSRVLDILKQFPGSDPAASTRASVWNNLFTNCRHIFMTRRNKVRLAVSWWRAIQTEEWNRPRSADPKEVDLKDAYSYDAINHLYAECVMREAGIQEFFAEAKIIPLTITYEDFILEYEDTVRRVLDYLDLESSGTPIDPPHFEKIADDISEDWVQRFRRERQINWKNHGW
jgi:LPS sulfotransferase NodH